ncbi:DUF2971 domain-containing protein [Neobacillus mesonae]|uniref:DUF2971 domain-containing protein n=1 Tax=Neobacillus mesonae TaxID=1193713 RepID=A0A3T0HSJ7_9BACI|nr:DUF2971 domain-containing protein [Neobacillus mesonae]AZU60110.1 DUF2971 domain-containing protein [Neobacillus mesonae]
MAYDADKWMKRIRYRSDLSGYVYHLTKAELDTNGKTVMGALDRLLKIISERKIIGSSTESGFITGNRKAVCFQDAPISGIVQNVLHENNFRAELGGKIRYTYLGLVFPKSYIFKNGGRPVLYENKETAKKILPQDEWWRIVNYDLSDRNNIVDLTHEREWRLPADEFNFDLAKVSVILPNQKLHQEFIEKIDPEDLKTITGMIQITPLVY